MICHKDKYYTIKKKTKNKEKEMENLVHHLSIIDCPGHQELIFIMLSSILLMKGAIVVVSAAEPLDQKPQLIQHLAAAKLANLPIILCHNKLDLVDKKIALKRKKELDEKLEEMGIVPKVIVPTCFSRGYGVENLLEQIVKHFPQTTVNDDEDILFMSNRSFDINKPGNDALELKPGIIGGSLLTGKLSIGDEIIVTPGLFGKNNKGELYYDPFITKIDSIQSDKYSLSSIIPGGLMGLGTSVSPALCKNDGMAGQVISGKNNVPKVYSELILNLELTDIFDGNWDPKISDNVFLQIGTVSLEAKLTKIEKPTKADKKLLKNKKNKNYIFKLLERPACGINTIILVSKKENNGLKIVAYGTLVRGKEII
jgi:translation initiation factor 2 subunit 3